MKPLTVDRILRHVRARIQYLEWDINRGEPYLTSEAAKDEMEKLDDWIRERS